MRKFVLPAVLFGSVLLAACGSDQAVKEPQVKSASTTEGYDLSKAREIIHARTETFTTAFSKFDTTTMAANFTADAWIHPPNHPAARGRDAAAFWGGALRTGLSRVSIVSNDMTAMKDCIIETGTYEVFAGPESVDRGKFLAVWKQDGDTWKMSHDTWNSDLPVKK